MALGLNKEKFPYRPSTFIVGLWNHVNVDGTLAQLGGNHGAVVETNGAFVFSEGHSIFTDARLV